MKRVLLLVTLLHHIVIILRAILMFLIKSCFLNDIFQMGVFCLEANHVINTGFEHLLSIAAA